MTRPLCTTLQATIATGALLLALAPHTAWGQRTRNQVDSTFAFGRNGYVEVTASSGDIRVGGWTRSEARVFVTSDGGRIELSLSSGRIVVGTRHNSHSRVEIMVPIGTRVNATASSGDVHVKNTNGEVEVRTSSGDVEVTDANDRVVIASSSGTVRAARLHGRVRLGGSSTDFDLDDITGDLEVKTVSGSIHIAHGRSAQVRATTVSGEITYAGTIDPSGTYEFSAHSGDVRLELPSTAAATLALQTYSGSISSRFPLVLEPGDLPGSRRGKKMNFTINNGGARVSAVTFSGDITIERTNRSSKED